MPAEIYLNVAVNGLLTGLVYGLMALGLSVIFGVVRVVNFAHGEMMTLAMYAVVVAFAGLRLDPFIMLVPVGANHQPVHQPAVFGPDARNVQTSYSFDSFLVGKLIVEASKAYAGATAIVIAAALFVFFRYATIGKAIRACAHNYQGALVVGLDVKRLYAFTFGIGKSARLF